MTYICRTHDTTDLLHRVQVRAESAVHGKDLFINDSCDRQAIETISECFPELDIIPPFAFVVKSIDSVDGGTFMITPEDEKILRILDFVGKE